MVSWVWRERQPPELSAMMEQDFHEAKHAGVVDLDTGDFAAPGGRSTWWP